MPPKKSNKKAVINNRQAFVNTKKHEAPTGTSKVLYRNLLIALSLAIITWVAVSPSLKNSFTNWDDPAYVYESNDIKSLSTDNIKHIFSSIIVYNYHPLTILSLALDYKYAKKLPGDFFGVDPYIFHRTSVFFHILNTLLVFALFYLLSKRRLEVAVIVALLFGIHPMHVESVSWVSERKDVLYGFFFIAGLIAWQQYVEKGARNFWLYVITLVLFILSILSKPAAAAFGPVLLLLDYYGKRRMSLRVVLEKIPYFIIALIIIYITFLAQSGESVGAWEVMTIPERFMFASYGFMAYIFKLLVPVNLSAFYPYPTTFPIKETLHWTFYAAPVAVVLVFASLVYFYRKKWHLPVFAILFYFFTIALVLQFVSVGKALMADRYSYIPYLGLSFLFAMGISRLIRDLPKSYDFVKYISAALLVVYFAFLGNETYGRTKVWKNNFTLWSDVIEKFPGKVDVAYKNRGNYFARETEEFDKALKDYNIFLSISPNDPTVYSNRGNLFGLQEKFELSVADYTKAISLDSNYVDPIVNRGITYIKMGKPDKAIADFNKALQLVPDNITYYRYRAQCLLQLGKADSALADYNHIISQGNAVPDDFFLRGVGFYQKKEYQKAIEDNTRAISMLPDMSGAYFNRSLCYKAIGNYAAALGDAIKAKELKQNQITDAYINELKNLVNKK